MINPTNIHLQNLNLKYYYQIIREIIRERTINKTDKTLAGQNLKQIGLPRQGFTEIRNLNLSPFCILPPHCNFCGHSKITGHKRGLAEFQTT